MVPLPGTAVEKSISYPCPPCTRTSWANGAFLSSNLHVPVPFRYNITVSYAEFCIILNSDSVFSRIRNYSIAFTWNSCVEATCAHIIVGTPRESDCCIVLFWLFNTVPNVCFSETGVIGAVWIRWIYSQSSAARRSVGVSPSLSRFCSFFGSWSRRT